MAAASWFSEQGKQGKMKLDVGTVGYIVSLCVFKGAPST